MKKTIDSRLLTLLRASSGDLYERLSNYAERNNKSRSDVVADAVISYLTQDTDARFEYLLELEKRIQTARAKYRDNAAAILRVAGADDKMVETMRTTAENSDLWPSMFE